MRTPITPQEALVLQRLQRHASTTRLLAWLLDIPQPSVRRAISNLRRQGYDIELRAGRYTLGINQHFKDNVADTRGALWF